MYAHTHTLHVGYSDVSPGVGTRHLESPEEIQMYCSDSEVKIAFIIAQKEIIQ